MPDGGVVWTPQPGSQTSFLTCPVFEVLYEGTRGPGKTDALIMDFAADCGQGLGQSWRGVLFRKTYPELADVIAKSKKWFGRTKNPPKFNEASSTWTWSGGEQLLLRHLKRPEDYNAYHGHEYPWVGFEELTTWATDECFTIMQSCCRSSDPKVAPRCRVRSTTNPYGIGHNWVKERYQLPRMRNRVMTSPVGRDGMPQPDRIAIHGHIRENRILLEADPGYIPRIRAAARNAAELAAWLDGSWDIVAGGMFDDVWDRATNVLPNFPVKLLPRSWKLDRSLDWGSAKPFSVGWWAESDGTPLEWEGRTIGSVRGDLIRFAEWYGWSGKRNEGIKMMPGSVAQGILDREEDMGLPGRVAPGPADHNIFSNDMGETADSIMRKKGVRWTKALKGPNSRVQGWEAMRQMMSQARPEAGTYVRERPGLFVCDRCEQFQETVPTLSRLKRNPDDIDSDAEDHIADEVRYRIRSEKRGVTVKTQ